MRYFLLSILFTVLIANCSVPTVDPIKESYKLDDLQVKYRHKVRKVNLNQSDQKLYKLGLYYLNKKFDFLRAEKVFRYLIKKQPNNADYQYYAARSILFIAEYNYYPNTVLPYRIAYSYFSLLVDRFSKNTKYLLMKSFSAFRIGQFQKRKFGLSNEVIEAFSQTKNLIDEILAIDSRHAEAKLTRAEIYYNSPTFLGGSKSKGVELYQEVRRQYPNNMRACVLLARYYRDQKQLDKAVEFFNKALTIYHEDKAAMTPERYFMFTTIPDHLGGIYFRQKKYKKALASTKLHLKRRPYSSSGYKQLGDCYHRLGQIARAIKAYKKALRYNNWNKGAKRNLARLENNRQVKN